VPGRHLRIGPKWILVDVFLKQAGRTWDGCEIARELASGDPPWSVMLVTHLPDDAREKTGGRVPTHVIGPVSKSDSMRELADALRGEYPPPAELAPVPAPASGVVGERRRSVKGTEKQIRHVVVATERRLQARVAVFSYDLFEDRARLVCARSGLCREFAAYGPHMHKSQIRDLAYQSSADAWDVYPLGRRKGDTWFWLRKILPFEPGFAAGVRLDSPDRDEVWSLFAFWPLQPNSSGSLISRWHCNRTLHELLRRTARIIEDARWHEHLEAEIERNRQEVQSARRSQNLAHEVRHEVSLIKANLKNLRGGRVDRGQDRVKFQRRVDECIQKCDHLHSVAETLLGTAKLSQGQHRLADVLDECTARNASECPDIGIPRARVVPEGLTVVGQKDLIITLLDNLLRNAAQAIRKTKSLRKMNTEGKFGEIFVEAFRCKGEPGRLEILVHDTGWGISRLACVQMVSEPLWPLGDEPQAECAGAIECSFDKTKEWESKPPIQRIVDLLVGMAGLLVFPDPQPLQINAYGISRNGRSCLGLASCLVNGSNDRKPAIDKDVVVWGQADSSGWEGAPKEPGPAAACDPKGASGLGQSYRFLLENHPAGKAAPAVAPRGLHRGSAGPDLMRESIPWRASDAADEGPSEWKYLLLGEPDNPTRPLVLLEVGAPRLPSCLDHCLAGGEAVCDLDLYLGELQKAVNELREERERQRGASVYDPPTFHTCDTREKLWGEVREAIHGLADLLQIPRDEIWWHYRDYVEESNRRGRKTYALVLPEDVVACSDSPYAKHAYMGEDCRRVGLPPPDEWGPAGAAGIELEDDPKAIKGKTLKNKENAPPSGSWLCRVSGEPILRHVPPSRSQTNYASVWQSATDQGDEDSIGKLDAIQSHGDFPVGTNANPVGTFHVQSTDDDLFIPAVEAYLQNVAEGIERAILRSLAEKSRGELEDLKQRQYRERIVRDSISGRLLELSQLVRKLQGTDPGATAALAHLVSQKATSLAVLQDLLHGEAPPPRRAETERCDLAQLLRKAVKRERAEIAGNPWYGGIDPVSILQAPERFPTCPVQADGQLLLEASHGLLRFGLRARDCANDKAETRIEVGLKKKDDRSGSGPPENGPLAKLLITGDTLCPVVLDTPRGPRISGSSYEPYLAPKHWSRLLMRREDWDHPGVIDTLKRTYSDFISTYREIEADLACVHVGSLERDVWSSAGPLEKAAELVYGGHHLGLMGSYRILTMLRKGPKLVLLSEFGEELVGFRTHLCGALSELLRPHHDGKDHPSPHVLPTDVDLCVDLRNGHVRCTRCPKTHHFSEVQAMERGSDFLHYVPREVAENDQSTCHWRIGLPT